MKKKYHMALIKEGYSQDSEMYKEIRRILDRENKEYRRDMEAREREGIVFNSLSAYVSEDGEEMDFPAEEEDVETKILHKIELDILRDCLRELPEDDREFLFALYEGGYGIEAKLARKYGLTRSAFRRKHERLLKQVKENFLKKFGEF